MSLSINAMNDDIDTPELSFFTIFEFVKKFHRTIVLCAMIGAIGLGFFQWFKPLEYTALASFIPETRQSSSSFSGFAAELGLGLLGGSGTQSPQFFADLANDPFVLKEAVTKEYRFTENGRLLTKNLIQVYKIDEPTQALAIEKAVRKLDKDVHASVAPKTGLISLRVSSITPDLAVQVEEFILDQINAINLRIRRASSTAERQFAEDQMSEFSAELRSAENRLLKFQQANREYTLSPRLQLEQERLEREVRIRNDVYTAMVSSYEQARVESVRDNPLISIIDNPLYPAKHDPRGVIKGVIGGLLLGALIGLLLGVVMNVWTMRRFDRQSE
jgi:uncharacterized protein involved in exopolysaccharide biosynthesis